MVHFRAMVNMEAHGAQQKTQYWTHKVAKMGSQWGEKGRDISFRCHTSDASLLLLLLNYLLRIIDKYIRQARTT